MKNISILILISVFIINTLSSQTFNPFGNQCDLTVPNPLPESNPSSIGGNYKPERTDYSWNPSNAVFRVMIIFASFQDDPFNSWANYWPVNGSPNYMNDVLSLEPNFSFTDYWEAYPENNLSDFWMEQSRGHFHVVGQAFNVVLPQRYQQYANIAQVMTGIYDKLLQNYPTINWKNFDRWRWSAANSRFEYEQDAETPADQYVDMIYVVHRSRVPVPGFPNGGIAQLHFSTQGENHLIDPVNSIYVNGNQPSLIASGVTMTPGWGETEELGYFSYAPLNREGVISFSEHEMGHYTFGYGHACYGKMSGSGAPFGVDECLSPWESIYMGYMTPQVVNYSITPSYSIGDFSSRNTNSQGEVIQVPISGGNEFFLIANRQKVSRYDKIMWGDTCKGNPFFDLGSKDYGKGVYIYHTPSGYAWTPAMDQECADGLWNWQYEGTRTPDWSNTQPVPYYTKTIPTYTNDNSFGGTTSKDGKSMDLWFSTGKKHTCIDWNQECSKGVDRVYTNDEDYWTSRENGGDRWDAWKIGYNQIFSPYSSPSTVSWGNQPTGIFIYIESQNGNTANFKIYQANANTPEEATVLAATPPSKPMGLTISLTDCVDNKRYPKITWNQNMEPDMVRTGYNVRTYMILKAWSINLTNIPVNYYPLAYVNAPASQQYAEYIDYGTYADCGTGMPSHYARYKVFAIDNGETVPEKYSVHSDFVSTAALVTNYLPWHVTNPNTAPDKFSLNQNYPNPFNPSTEIRYDLPRNSFVTIKIFNVTGQVVAALVNNEYKSAGYYSITFDGTNLASGIYFYTIEAGFFRDSKKMVLIK